jgi:hypothetical protein
MLEQILFKVMMYVLSVTAFVILLSHYQRQRNPQQSKDGEGEHSVYWDFAKLLIPAMIGGAILNIPFFLNFDVKGWLAGLLNGILVYIWPGGGAFTAATAKNLINVMFTISALFILFTQLFGKKQSRNDRGAQGSTLWNAVSPYLTIALLVFLASSLITFNGVSLSGFDLTGKINTALTTLMDNIFQAGPTP